MIENHSVSGKDYRAKGVHVYIPGLAVNGKAVRVEVPETAVDRLIEELRKTAPAVKVHIEKPVEQVKRPEIGTLDEDNGTEPKSTKPRRRAGGKKR